jgi:hypothetical protein
VSEHAAVQGKKRGGVRGSSETFMQQECGGRSRAVQIRRRVKGVRTFPRPLHALHAGGMCLPFEFASVAVSIP